MKKKNYTTKSNIFDKMCNKIIIIIRDVNNIVQLYKLMTCENKLKHFSMGLRYFIPLYGHEVQFYCKCVILKLIRST